MPNKDCKNLTQNLNNIKWQKGGKMGLKKIIRNIKISIQKLSQNRKRGFDHIISLGYNCEVAYSFLKYFYFEESGLFNWAYSKNIDDLINALKDTDNIGKNGFVFVVSGLWECQKTFVQFHGKEDNTKNGAAEVTSRLNYLKNKFVKIAQSDDKKLYIYKMKTSQIDQKTPKKLEMLWNALAKNVGAKNFQLLVVCEQNAKPIKSSDKYITRTVKFFAPDTDVTNGSYMRNGWDDIFYEFYPKKIGKKPTKKYKFDKK